MRTFAFAAGVLLGASIALAAATVAAEQALADQRRRDRLAQP